MGEYVFEVDFAENKAIRMLTGSEDSSQSPDIKESPDMKEDTTFGFKDGRSDAHVQQKQKGNIRR